MKALLNRINNKKIAVLSVLLYIGSMLPLWYLSRYARPSGDDYGYSILTHTAWIETHSLWAVFKAAAVTVRNFYEGWNGDWFTTFLFALMPEVFRPYSFWIVPLLMTGIVIAATTFLLYELCVNVLQISKEDFVIFDMLLLFASYQFVPSTAISMYWYVGAVHYMLPHAAALTGIGLVSVYLRTGKLRYNMGTALCMLAVGGGSYFSSLLVFMLYALLLIVAKREYRRKVFALGFPICICMIGFVIQCISPGNSVRGGDAFGIHGSVAIYTIIEALRRSAINLLDYFYNKSLIYIVLLVIVLFGWESVSKRRSKFRFRFPILFVILMYGIYSAMLAPEVYSELYSSIEISLGPATVQYFVFLLAAAASIIYIEGWVHWRINGSTQERIKCTSEIYRRRILYPALLLLLLLVLFNRSWLKDSVAKEAIDYIVSGQATDFQEQISSQMEILLDDSVKDAYLVPINPEQGPLMHMPVTEDENAFTNRVIRDFYHKDKVVMITNEEKQ